MFLFSVTGTVRFHAGDDNIPFVARCLLPLLGPPRIRLRLILLAPYIFRSLFSVSAVSERTLTTTSNLQVVPDVRANKARRSHS
jgi:hypothetical protein